jgi:hypothetical protein
LGKLFVVLLATILTMGILFATFPTLQSKVAFDVGEHPIKLALLLSVAIGYIYYKLTD